MVKITPGEQSIEKTIHDLRMLYGGESEKADASKWVFVPEGVKSGHGVSFYDEYSSALKGLRKQMAPLPGARLYFDTDFESEPRDGKEAEKFFFDYFNTTADYFSHPANIGKLGLITRQFLSHYVDEDLLKDVDPKICQKLEELEDEVVKTCPGSRAAMADLLRMIYNRALSNVLTEDEAVEIRAGKFGTQGRSLTLIDMPADLLARRRMDEIQMSRQGRVYCVGGEKGDVYQRGGWTDLEWESAKSQIEMESGGNAMVKAARLKAADQFFFPQKVCYSVGSCLNLLKALRDTVVSQCKERREFSILRLTAVLRERAEDGYQGSGTGASQEYSNPGGERDYDYDYDPAHTDYDSPGESRGGAKGGGRGLEGKGDEFLDDEEELDAPLMGTKSAKEVGENQNTGTAEKTKTGDKDDKVEPKTKTETRRPKQAKTPEQKATSAFSKKWGIKSARETSEIEEIFKRREKFTPSDYSPELAAFCKTEELPKGTDVQQWISSGQRARGIEEAKILARKSLPPRGPGKVAFVVEKDGGEMAVLLAKRSEASGDVLFKELGGEEVKEGGKMRNGKLFFAGGDGGFRPISGIVRVPYKVPTSGGGEMEEKPKGLLKGGIFSFLRKFGRGNLDK